MASQRPGLQARLGYGWTGLAARLGGVAAAGLVISLVNTASEQTDIVRRHLEIAPIEPAIWELTSWVAVVVATIFLLAGEQALVARRPWPPRAAALAICAVAFCAVHVGLMIGLRVLIYAAGGATYRFGPIVLGLLYEARKDALTFTAAVALFWLWRRAFETPRAAVAAANDAEPAFIAESRYGQVVLRAPEIDWVEAQGNYVALHARGQSYLIRQPLKAVDEKLRGAAFVRTHRSALVNTRRVLGIQRSDAGLKVALANDELAPLSDRHRAAVVKALAAG